MLSHLSSELRNKNLGAIVLAFAITGSTSRSISEALEKQKKKDEGAVAKALVQPADQGAKVPPVNTNEVALTRQPVSEQGKSALPDDSTEEWVTAPTPAKLGDVVVKIASAKIDRVPLEGPAGESKSAEPLLILGLEITNTNPNRKIDYRGWAGEGFSFERDNATLKDNNGNSYKRISFGSSGVVRPIGGSESGSIYPDKLFKDVLVYEVPLKTADSLDLELPAKNVGEKGFFRIRVPSTMVQR